MLLTSTEQIDIAIREDTTVHVLTTWQDITENGIVNKTCQQTFTVKGFYNIIPPTPDNTRRVILTIDVCNRGEKENYMAICRNENGRDLKLFIAQVAPNAKFSISY